MPRFLYIYAHMTQPSDSSIADPLPLRSPRTRLRKELTMAGVFLGLGFVVLPIGIYLVGTAVLGAYGGGPHIGSFFGDFYRNLLDGVGRTWFLVLSPYLAFLLSRALFFRWQAPSSTAAEQVPEPEPARDPQIKERREPFVAP
jgi:hypothetical protein